jgi:hypothetical protein
MYRDLAGPEALSQQDAFGAAGFPAVYGEIFRATRFGI